MNNKNLVNWSDSMPLSAAVFNQQDDYVIDSIRDSIEARTTDYNYGLLPMAANQDKDNGIRIGQYISGNIEICLNYCNAITSSGVRIRYDASQMGKELIKTYSVESDIKKNIRLWDIIVSVDPFKRIAFGDINPDEVPPRHPKADSTYHLFIMPKGEINTTEFGAHYLTIGRIRKDAERFMVDADFIPPCTSINSHPELVSYYDSFSSMFRSFENCNMTILRKINGRADRSDLAVNIALICRENLRYLSTVHFGFVNQGRYYAPIEAVRVISSLAHLLYIGFGFMPGAQKDEILKYFYEWSDVTPGSFDELLANTLEMRYDHTDIRSSMILASTFMYTITELWQRLSSLEYIGQHKDNIVVSERKNSATSTSGSTWSVID